MSEMCSLIRKQISQNAELIDDQKKIIQNQKELLSGQKKVIELLNIRRNARPGEIVDKHITMQVID